jgi:membrane-bound metal-dependent hydrolase YbcI (DUF457 family)
VPFTPYHIGPNGVIAFLFRRWLDVPVLILANVVIDLEVLWSMHFAHPGQWPHRIFHLHTLLIGGLAGAVFGVLCWRIVPIRRLLAWGMSLLKIPYRPRPWSMTLSGLLGAWLHVLVDAIYHFDVQLLWPSDFSLYMWFWHHKLFGKHPAHYVKPAGLVLAGLLLILWAYSVFSNYRIHKKRTA